MYSVTKNTTLYAHGLWSIISALASRGDAIPLKVIPKYVDKVTLSGRLSKLGVVVGNCG